MRSMAHGLPLGEFLVVIILVGLSLQIMIFDRYEVGYSPLALLGLPLKPLRDFAVGITRVHSLVNENSILRSRLTELAYENAVLRQSLKSMLEDSKLVNFAKDYPDTLVFARIMTYLDRRDGGGVIIDKGSKAGVSSNMVVITPAGLAGIVTKISSTASHVRLIDEPGYRVSAKIGRGGYTGILSATPDGRLLMEWVAPDAKISPGDTVVTSGLGMIAPEGIPIGTVVATLSEPEKFSKVVEVKPFEDLRHLEDVAIILRKSPDFSKILDDMHS